MTVPYTGCTAQIVDLAATMLATSATFQALVSEVTVNGARGHIVEIDDTPPVGAHGVINSPDVDFTREAADAASGNGSVDVMVLYPPAGGQTETESYRAACNTSSAIVKELMEYDHLLVRGISAEKPVKMDASDELADWFQLVFTITVQCLP